MDWLQFTASVVSSLAWPLAAVCLGFMFREQVRKLLEKMKSLRAPGGIEASFSEEIKKVAEEAKEIRVETARLPAPEVIHSDLKPENIRRLSPKDMMVRAWSYLEEAVIRFAAATGATKDLGKEYSFDDVVVALIYQRKLPTKTLGLLQELRDLKLDLIEKDLDPSRADAVYFLGTANAVADYVGALTQENLKGNG